MELLIGLYDADGRPLFYHRVSVFSREHMVQFLLEVAHSNIVDLAYISRPPEEGLPQPYQHVRPELWHDGQALAHGATMIHIP